MTQVYHVGTPPSFNQITFTEHPADPGGEQPWQDAQTASPQSQVGVGAAVHRLWSIH